jgi:electron transfer flavoprotein beta subunit
MELNIVVCVKQVPVSNNLKIDPVTKNLIRSSEPGMINPFDKNALEAALKLKEAHGGSVTVLSMGPENFKITLREALAMGVDRAILLSSRAFGGADTLATGYVLASAIKRLGNVDLVFFGRQSIDADTGQVGPIVADFLDFPQLTYISEISLVKDSKIIVKRLMENMEQTIEVTLPAVFTVRDELNIPRYATPRNIINSFNKEIEVLTEKDLNVDLNRIGVKGSPTIVRSVWSPEVKKKNYESLGSTEKEAVLRLLEILKLKNVL